MIFHRNTSFCSSEYFPIILIFYVSSLFKKSISNCFYSEFFDFSKIIHKWLKIIWFLVLSILQILLNRISLNIKKRSRNKMFYVLRKMSFKLFFKASLKFKFNKSRMSTFHQIDSEFVTLSLEVY